MRGGRDRKRFGSRKRLPAETANIFLDTASSRISDGSSSGRHPEITGAWEVTGDDDYVLKVQVGSMADYDTFIRRALGDDNGVASFKTLITINTLIEEDASTRPSLAGSRIGLLHALPQALPCGQPSDPVR